MLVRVFSLGATLLLAGCFFKSPAQGLTFRAPAGWMATPPLNGSQTWIRLRRNDSEALILSRLQRTIDLAGGMRMTRIPGAIPFINVGPQAVLARREITLCGNQPALYLKTSMNRIGAQPVVLEMVFSNTSGGAILSGYTRPATQPADPEAEAALYELCPSTG